MIKYVPEGTSRVLLARTAVHFQDVLEKFAPYDALLEISNAEGLNDTSLAASFPLRTATPSGSSSRLDEITEDGEDSGSSRAIPSPVPSARTPTGSYFSSQRHRMEKRMEQRMLSDRSVLAGQAVDPPKAAARPTSPLSSSSPSPIKTSVSQFLVRSDSGKPSITSLGSESVASTADYAPSEESTKETRSSMSTAEASKAEASKAKASTLQPLRPAPAAPPSEPSSSDIPVTASRGNVIEPTQPVVTPRASAEKEAIPTRQNTSETTNYEKDLFDFLKPKPKLAPRPVTATERAKRPAVASVSSMPATYRQSMRKQEQPRQAPPVLAPSPLMNKPLPTPPPIPETPDYNPRPLSRGSVKSMPSHKSTAMTPDKLRLMKAVELRRKQQRKSNPIPAGFVPPPDEEAPPVPQVPEQQPAPEEPPVAPTKEPEPEPAPAPASPEVIAKRKMNDETFTYKADSGIEMDYEKRYIQKEKAIANESPIEEPEQHMPEVVERSTKVASISTPPQTPKLDMPGSFLHSDSSDHEEEPILDPKLHLGEQPDEAMPETTPDELVTPTTAESVSIVPSGDKPQLVPAIVMADGSRPITPSRQPIQENDSRSVDSDINDKSGDESVSSQGLATAWEMSPKRNNTDLARRRQGYVEPLQVDSESDVSEDEDDFVDELQHAQVAEVKHVMVSKSSPVQEFLPTIRRPSATSGLSEGVAVPRQGAISPSSPISVVTAVNVNDLRKSPPETYRPTAPTLESSEQAAGPKRNVSSEISKRIQALAGTSSKENSPPVNNSSRPITPDSASILSSMRNTTHIRNRSLNALSKYSSRTNSTQSNAPTNPVQQPTYSVQHDPSTNRDSVSVTARIVRPRPSEDLDTFDSNDASFQQSQITINHKRGTPSQSSVPQLQRIDTRPESLASRQDSITPLSSTSPTLARSSKESTSILQPASLSRAATSPITDDASLAPSSPPIGSTDDSSVAPKESGSRTSRFFKRMSHIGGKRKSGMHQLADGTTLAAAVANAPSKEKVNVQSVVLPAVTVGDLNIQFPDSLVSNHIRS